MAITFNVDQYTLYEGDTLYVRGYRSGDDADVAGVELSLLGNPNDYRNYLVTLEGAIPTANSNNAYTIYFNEQTDSFIVGFKVLNDLTDFKQFGLSMGPNSPWENFSYDAATFRAIDGARPGGPLGEKAYITPLSSDPLSPGIWRFLNVDSGDHFYSEGPEADFVNDNIVGYNLEGVAFGSLAANQGMPTWRFINRENGDHFWTASQEEYDNLAFNKQFNVEWKYEGLAFNVYSPEQPQPAGTVPVYRALNTSNGDHFWTANPLELAGLIAGYPAWESEGVAWYSPA